MVLFLGIMTLGLLLAVASLSYQSYVYRNAKQISSKEAATFGAEAGIEKALNSFLSSATFTGESITLGNANITTNLVAGSTANEKFIEASSTVNDQIRRLRVKIATQASGTAVAFRYALQAGNLGINMGNGSSITGNLYSNQNITAGNGASVTGDASAVGTISNELTVSGQKLTGQPSQAMPEFDANFWKTKAQAGTNINGDYAPVNNAIIGPLYVNGKITFGNSVNITIKGPIYATGGITFGNGVILTIDSSLNPQGVMIVADGTITFGNTLDVVRPNDSGYILIVSNSTSDTAIDIGNGTAIVKAPLFTPNGGIKIGNNAHAVAFTGKKVTLGNNAVITYESGLASSTYATGPGGTWTILKGSYQEF